MATMHPFAKLPRPDLQTYTPKIFRAKPRRGTDNGQTWEEPGLPSTDLLVSALRSARSLEAFEQSEEADNLASYRVAVETDRPAMRFRVTQGSEAFLTFAGRSEPGFEVLELICSGFQYHWRSDLAKVAENRLPHLGRMSITDGQLGCHVEHLAVPRFSNGRVVEICGWFCFDRQKEGCMPPKVLWNDVTIARRSRRSRPIKMPWRLVWTNPWEFFLRPRSWFR
mgnify:CR=1 FL=1